ADGRPHPHRLERRPGHGLRALGRRGRARAHRVRAQGELGMKGERRAERLFVVLACFFVANALMAEFIGVKIFAMEPTLGIAPLNWNLYGQTGSLNFTAGVLLWPVVFLMTDVVNEFYGRKGVRMISWVAAGLIAYSFLFAFV